MFKNEEGFSLLELVVAVGVAGIIAAVALPTFAGLQDKATTTSATYAASASAAEALANSTIGNTGGNGSASTTGGASSSSNINTSITVDSSTMNVLGIWNSGSYAYLQDQTTEAGSSFDQLRIAAANNGLAGRTITFNGSLTPTFVDGSGDGLSEASQLSGNTFTISSSNSYSMMGGWYDVQIYLTNGITTTAYAVKFSGTSITIN